MEKKTTGKIRTVSDDIKRIVLHEVNFYKTRPKSATFFLTFRCNSHCRTCTLWSRPKEEELRNEIGLAEWKCIADRLIAAGITSVEIFGGNVLLRKDLLIPLLEYLHAKKLMLYMPTNQIGMDEDIARAIVTYLDYVYLSVDGIDIHQDAIRGQKGAFQRADDAIVQLLKLKTGSCSKLRIVCNTTVSNCNVGLLDQIIEYAIARQFDDIHFEYVGEFSQEHLEHSRINGLKPAAYYIRGDDSVLLNATDARRLKRSLKEIKRKYAGSGIRISTVNIDVLSEKNLRQGTIPHKKCYVERTEVTVDPAGNVVICPFINNYVLGNLLNTPLADIWNNPRHREFRRYQNSGSLEMCGHCVLGIQRNPGLLLSLKRHYLTRIQPYLARKTMGFNRPV
ncbi:MAG: radical SAM protein [Desulfobacteraceae bacterium]|nr:MAG: radical SAM protein [Desulfobacteraceae bacterium]